jgi:competence protein ComEC
MVACSASPDAAETSDTDESDLSLSRNGISVHRANGVNEVPHGAPAVGSYRIHLIDVGTGLAVLVQGHDFNLLFDGGSNDDKGTISQTGNHNRLLAYLYAAVGASGPAECVPEGDKWAAHDTSKRLVLDHVFLSHPHNDHMSLMNDVVRCYDVKNFWDSGDPYSSDVYLNLLERIGQQHDLAYRTAAPVTSKLQVYGKTVSPMPAQWTEFTDSTPVTLDKGASFEILHADGASYPDDANKNSIVARLQLGKTSLLLVGDAESGAREDPSAAVGDVEAELLAKHLDKLKVDILQVGHHGSKTSSREAFLQAIEPKYALIGVGPTAYSGVRLPDPEVIHAISTLPSKPVILRTDKNDAKGCDTQDRVGLDNSGPGGCDNYILTVK